MASEQINLQSFYPEDLEVKDILQSDSMITIKMNVHSKRCICPKCGVISSHKHGTYERKIQDLPILGKSTQLLVNAYEYQCDNNDCNVTTFAETVHGFLSYYSRMTKRCADFICTLAMETSCEGCSRICRAMNLKISGDETTHTPVAILDGRDGGTLKDWLRKNQHVKIVTRDRASAYASAIQEILPDAMQVADRFHLHQNLLNVVKNTISAMLPSDVKIPADIDKNFDVGFKPDGPDTGKKNAMCCG